MDDPQVLWRGSGVFGINTRVTKEKQWIANGSRHRRGRNICESRLARWPCGLGRVRSRATFYQEHCARLDVSWFRTWMLHSQRRPLLLRMGGFSEESTEPRGQHRPRQKKQLLEFLLLGRWPTPQQKNRDSGSV